MKISYLILGGGLSGLAAGIRLSRYTENVHIFEKHHRCGGLNSFYTRGNYLFETGLHAFTNYAEPSEKKVPLNTLFRQLKLARKEFTTYVQLQSKILFKDQESLVFNNNIETLTREIKEKFPNSFKGFQQLILFMKEHDYSSLLKFSSARDILCHFLPSPLLVEMLLCPLFYYGSSTAHDMSIAQFNIMFRSIYLEGFFRPGQTMKEFLDMLVTRFLDDGGQLHLSTEVTRILHNGRKAHGVELSNGEIIECDHILSTVGRAETRLLLDGSASDGQEQERNERLSFLENIFVFNKKQASQEYRENTIIFYNTSPTIRYSVPTTPVDFTSGVICFPAHFQGRPETPLCEIRSTHLANYQIWKDLLKDKRTYNRQKSLVREQSFAYIQSLLGPYPQAPILEDSFTPTTIERYTGKKRGAIYGSPHKIHDGDIGFDNLYLAGTDQGFQGIVGSMLSGITIVNNHLLSKM